MGPPRDNKLTFNPTSLNLARARAANLVSYELPRPVVGPRRWILAPAEIEKFVRSGSPTSMFSPYAAREVLARFISRFALKLSQKRTKGKRKDIELERLEGIDEVWALCIRKPGSGWRMMGRFLERDVFVIFAVEDKGNIGSDYGPVAAEVIAGWQKYFGSQPPCSGAWVSGYLTGEHYDADTKENIYGG